MRATPVLDIDRAAALVIRPTRKRCGGDAASALRYQRYSRYCWATVRNALLTFTRRAAPDAHRSLSARSPCRYGSTALLVILHLRARREAHQARRAHAADLVCEICFDSPSTTRSSSRRSPQESMRCACDERRGGTIILRAAPAAPELQLAHRRRAREGLQGPRPSAADQRAASVRGARRAAGRRRRGVHGARRDPGHDDAPSPPAAGRGRAAADGRAAVARRARTARPCATS